jgi:uncharacterized membrane protein YeaQ/YmgE (transglycosylase-associated protein family)
VLRELLRFMLVGLVAGWIANVAVRGGLRSRGCLTNVVVGMVGAVIGGFLFERLDLRGFPGFLGSVVTATIGAIVLLVLLRVLRES